MKALATYPTIRGRKFRLTRKTVPLASLVSKPFKLLFNRLVPIGYEDEEGFHYATQNGQMQEKRPVQQGAAGDTPQNAASRPVL
jgi:hypothetical protein